MYEKETMLVGFDIHKFVKGICNQFIDGSPDMEEPEKKAYRLGVEAVLSLLDQTLNEFINEGGEDYNNIAVHIPGLDTMTEFYTIEEIEKEMNFDGIEYDKVDIQLPETPKVSIYKETFGSLIDITDEWYKNNRD